MRLPVARASPPRRALRAPVAAGAEGQAGGLTTKVKRLGDRAR